MFLLRALLISTVWDLAAAGTLKSVATEGKRIQLPRAATLISSPNTAGPNRPVLALAAQLTVLGRSAGSNTCGYVNGGADLPWTCPGGGDCEFDVTSSVAGCCYSQPCTITSVCYDFAAGQQGACDPGKVGVGTSCW